MGWATELHLVSLLEKYLSLYPRVTALVRAQLMTVDHKGAITEALHRVTNLFHVIDTPYDTLLNHTCLEWHDEQLVTQVSPDLPSAMFDLMLGERVRKMLLNRYSDIHSVRACIEDFIDIWVDDLEPHSKGMELWWDGVSADAAPHERWVSRGLREDRDLETLLKSWGEDNRSLQDWLRRFERTTTLANNWGEDGSWVFSEEAAIHIMAFAKVRFPSMPEATSHPFQAQGKLLDDRRRARFLRKPVLFKEKCEQLGLFRTRLPGFSQLFFHDFSKLEVYQRKGQTQTGGVVSRRAAETYLRSGVRLESSCGISDVWYSYVEHNIHLFREPEPPTAPSSPAVFSGISSLSDLSTIPLLPSLSPHPRPDIQEMETIQSSLNWHKIHSRPRPTKRIANVPKPSASEPEGRSEDSAIPTSNTTAFSKASAHPSLRGLAAVGQDDEEEKDEHSEPILAIGKEEQAGKGSVRVEQEVGIEGVGEKDNTSEFDLDEWPITASFSNALDTAMTQLFVEPSVVEEPESQVSQGWLETAATMPDPGNTSTSGFEPVKATEVIYTQTEGARMLRKRAHQDSDDCKES
jgi:hypothetical protein